jgi:hypothetical protein
MSIVTSQDLDIVATVWTEFNFTWTDGEIIISAPGSKLTRKLPHPVTHDVLGRELVLFRMMTHTGV